MGKTGTGTLYRLENPSKTAQRVLQNCTELEVSDNGTLSGLLRYENSSYAQRTGRTQQRPQTRACVLIFVVKDTREPNGITRRVVLNRENALITPLVTETTLVDTRHRYTVSHSGRRLTWRFATLITR